MEEGDAPDPVERARELVGDDAGELSIDDLVMRLTEARRVFHPDNFRDEEQKKVAEGKFKEIPQLVKALTALRERSLTKLPANELIRRQPTFAEVDERLRTFALEQENETLKAENRYLQLSVDALKKEYEDAVAARRDRDLEELKGLYQPSRRRLVSLAITAVLAAAMYALTRVQAIADELVKSSAVQPDIIRRTAFAAMLIVLVIAVWQYLRHVLFNNMIAGCQTTSAASDFLTFVNENFYGHHDPRLSVYGFDEINVLRFIEERFGIGQPLLSKLHSGTTIWYVLRRRIRDLWHASEITAYRAMGLHTPQTVDRLKEAFIFYLIDRRLIEPRHANKLVHVFTIKRTSQFQEEHPY